MRISDELHLPIIAFLTYNIDAYKSESVFGIFLILDFQVSGFCVVICAQALNKCSIPHAKRHNRLWASMRIAKIEISNVPRTHTQIITKLEISHFWNFVSVFSSSSCAFAVLFLFFLFFIFVATCNAFRHDSEYSRFILARRAFSFSAHSSNLCACIAHIPHIKCVRKLN